jgi:hypothetical protein
MSRNDWQFDYAWDQGERTMNQLRMVFLALVLAYIARASTAVAGGDPASNGPVIYPAFESQPGACYVLLRPNDVQVLGEEDHPFCPAVLDNFNKFCDLPPLYDRRKVHPSVTALSEPEWRSIDVKSNLDLVKATYLADVLPEYRDIIWGHDKQLILSRADSGSLRLWRGDLRDDLRSGLQTVFMLENSSPDGQPNVTNEPRLMFAERGRETPSPLLNPLGNWGTGDVWCYRDYWGVCHWFLIKFESNYGWFLVMELMRPTPGPSVSAPTVCNIQHVKDRRGSK